ncbi:MAG: N,N-dimethylformamidase beta subunit family domain-containing protein [Gemmatimonadaceae bacterium]
MAHIALATDADGCLWSVDFHGTLFWNGPADAAGERAADAPWQYRGFGVPVGTGWTGVVDLFITEIGGERIVAGVDNAGALFAAAAPAGQPLDGIDAADTDVRWPVPLHTMVADADGHLYGVAHDGIMHRLELHREPASGLLRNRLPSVMPSRSAVQGVRTICSSGRRLFAVDPSGDVRSVSSTEGFADPGALAWSPVRGLSIGPQSILGASDLAIYVRGSEGGIFRYALTETATGLACDDPAQPVPVGYGCDTWAGLPAGVEGYASSMSVAPGEQITFYVAERLSPNPTAPISTYTAAIVRLRRLADGKEQVADTLIADIPGSFHAPTCTLQDDLATNGAHFPEAFSFTMPDDAPSGLYAARCTDAGTNAFYIPFVVRPKTKQQPFALMANTNTWNCYNSWGGLGKYAHDQTVLATHLPFHRPAPCLTPDVLAEVPLGPTAVANPPVCKNELLNQTKHLVRAELWILGWLEDQGSQYGVDVYADQDLHHGIAGLSAEHLADRYAALILSTHPEYWTAEMYDAVQQYQARGGSILYLGANGMFERVEYLPTAGGVDGLRVFPGKDPAPGEGNEQARVPSLMRNQRRPERAILGNGFETVSGVTVKGSAYQLVLDPGASPLLQGVTIGRGSTFGTTAIVPGYAAVGHEIDYRDAAHGSPAAAMVPTALIARGTGTQSAAEMVYFETQYGGLVFAAGSLNFGKSLVVDPTLQQIVRNAMDLALRRSPLVNS